MEGEFPANRLTWATIVIAFVGSVVMYGVLAYTLQQSGSRPPASGLEAMRLPTTLLGVMSLVASVVWAQWRLAVRGEYASATRDIPAPKQFIAHTLIALSFAEACAVFGLLLFFIGASFADFLMFAVPSMAVMLFFVLPKGSAYWTAWESRQEE